MPKSNSESLDKIQELRQLERRVAGLERALFRLGTFASAAGIALAVSLGFTWSQIPERARTALEKEPVVQAEKAALAAAEEARAAADRAGDSAETAESDARRVGLIPDGAVPAGAIVAFSLSACPSGWEEAVDLHGRTIVGAGEGRGLSRRRLGDTGGKELVLLSLAQIPEHKHPTVEAGDPGNSSWGVGTAMNGRDGTRWRRGATTSYSGPSGGGEAHENMPPFVVFLYCRRR